jgi:predicted Zn-dependent protease
VSGETPLQLAERALAKTDFEAQATVVAERSLLSRFARSAPTQATFVDDVSVEVLAVVDGHTAGATTNSTDDEALAEAARRAHAAATAAARGGPGEYPGLPLPRPVAAKHAGYDSATAALDPAVAGDALAAAFEVCGEQGLEAFGVWTAGEVVTAIASSTGIASSDAVTDAHMKVICRDARGRSGYAAATGVSFGAIDATSLARTAAGKVSAEEATTLAPGEYPVVLDADAVGTLLEFLGDLAFNGLAHAEGRGALVGRLGTRVAAAAINLADSVRFPGTLPRAFDAEGVPKAPVPLIQDGVANTVVHDTRSAAEAGGSAQSTGHALVPGGAGGGPAPTNLVLSGGGTAGVAELVAGVPRGLYVTRLWYVNAVDERRTLLTGMTRDGTFLIEDGRIARPLQDVRFTDSVLRILSATTALTGAQRLTSEADFYGRRFATGVVCPALRADGFRVTGSAAR